MAPATEKLQSANERALRAALFHRIKSAVLPGLDRCAGPEGNGGR